MVAELSTSFGAFNGFGCGWTVQLGQRAQCSRLHLLRRVAQLRRVRWVDPRAQLGSFTVPHLIWHGPTMPIGCYSARLGLGDGRWALAALPFAWALVVRPSLRLLPLRIH